ncbi:hypothetical protein CR513_45883, partial [Mucuna pruriens]
MEEARDFWVEDFGLANIVPLGGDEELCACIAQGQQVENKGSVMLVLLWFGPKDFVAQRSTNKSSRIGTEYTKKGSIE